MILPEHWTDAEFIEIDKASILRYRVDTSQEDWFTLMFERVIRRDSAPTRSAELTVLPKGSDIEAFKAYYYTAEAEDLADDGNTATKRKQMKRQDFYSRIERFNIQCFQHGYGQAIPLSPFVYLGTSAYVPHTWSAQSLQAYQMNARKLPKRMCVPDVSPSMRILIINAINVSLDNSQPWAGTSPTMVSLVSMDRLPFPCLHQIKLLRDEGNFTSPHILIPQECIDYTGIYRDLTNKLRKKSPKITYGVVRSSDEFIKQANASGNWGQATIDAARMIDLSKYLFGRDMYQFQVREGKEDYDTVNQFVDDHAAPSDQPRYVRWYTLERVALQDDYLVVAGDYFQMILDKVLHRSRQNADSDDEYVEDGDHDGDFDSDDDNDDDIDRDGNDNDGNTDDNDDEDDDDDDPYTQNRAANNKKTTGTTSKPKARHEHDNDNVLEEEEEDEDDDDDEWDEEAMDDDGPDEERTELPPKKTTAQQVTGEKTNEDPNNMDRKHVSAVKKAAEKATTQKKATPAKAHAQGKGATANAEPREKVWEVTDDEIDEEDPKKVKHIYISSDLSDDSEEDYE